MARCSIVAGAGGLIFKTSSKPPDAMIASLKAQIPPVSRKWDHENWYWVIDAQYGGVLADLCLLHLGETVQLPLLSAKAAKVVKALDVRYIGQCKPRDDGSLSAFGWSDNNWSVVFPEDVLRNWFEAGPSITINTTTLYSILGSKQADSVDAIKTAYRRTALQYHPDVNKEPDAQEQFLKIQHAYEILSNPLKRERYNAGLALEATLSQSAKPAYSNLQSGSYKSPLRCGLLMVEGTETIGRVVVGKILMWKDIKQGNKTLVPTWPMGAKAPQEAWI